MCSKLQYKFSCEYPFTIQIQLKFLLLKKTLLIIILSQDKYKLVKLRQNYRKSCRETSFEEHNQILIYGRTLLIAKYCKYSSINFFTIILVFINYFYYFFIYLFSLKKLILN